MTVPQGAKIIVNKFRTRCLVCKAWVEAEAGAAILDANITGKWATFHLTPCLPAPYEAGDVHPASGVVWHKRGPVAPGHERCLHCSHWQTDHQPTGCGGNFRGAPTQVCQCPGFTPHTPAATIAPPPVATTVHALNAGLISQATALAQVAPVNAPTIVVFYGPIKSVHDGEEHFIYPASVANLHGITTEVEARTHVQYVSPEQKRTWRPPTGDYFVIGPHFHSSEYDEVKQALAEWLEQRGIVR